MSRHPIGTPAPRSRRDAAARRIVPIAIVRLGEEKVVVARVEAWILHDPFERAVLSTALQLTYQRQAILMAWEPCGCREAWGDERLTAKLLRLPDKAFQWQTMPLSFATH